MCDYCNCRSHPEIATLSADHEMLLELLTRLHDDVARGDRTGAVVTVEALHAILHVHADTEERGVFTELGEAGVGADYLGGFRGDHDHVHRLLAEATTEHWRPAAAELVDLLRGHIAREESDLFPAAHQLLTPAQWDRVDAVHDAVHVAGAGAGRHTG